MQMNEEKIRDFHFQGILSVGISGIPPGALADFPLKRVHTKISCGKKLTYKRNFPIFPL